MAKIVVCKVCKQEKVHKAYGMCRRCYDYSRKEVCSSCGKLKPTNIRLDGEPFCASCYTNIRAKEQCYKCNEIKHTHFRTTGGLSVCEKCYTKHFRPKISLRFWGS